jgi:hypothetical protein
MLQGYGYSEKNDIWLCGLIFYMLLSRKSTNTKKIIKGGLKNDFEEENFNTIEI